MAVTLQPLTTRPAWKALEAHHQQIRDQHLAKLFAEDATRGERLTVEAVGLYLHYSKNRITDEMLTLLRQLREQSRLRERIGALFRGDNVNAAQDREVLHLALR